MVSVGSFVKFTWWSSYKAPSVSNDDGKTSWHEINPGDIGVVLCIKDEEHIVVLFSHVDSLLTVHKSMVSLVD